MSNPPGLTTKFSMPQVLWHQTDLKIVLRILLQDIDDYFLQVGCDHLLFSTRYNYKDYCVCLKLFGTVVAEHTTHQNLGREIRIELVKGHKWLDWLRLHFVKEKNNMIIPDPDHLEKKKQDARMLAFGNMISFTEYKRMNDLTNIMPDVPSSDEEESDDEATLKLLDYGT